MQPAKASCDVNRMRKAYFAFHSMRWCSWFLFPKTPHSLANFIASFINFFSCQISKHIELLHNTNVHGKSTTKHCLFLLICPSFFPQHMPILMSLYIQSSLPAPSLFLLFSSFTSFFLLPFFFPSPSFLSFFFLYSNCLFFFPVSSFKRASCEDVSRLHTLFPPLFLFKVMIKDCLLRVTTALYTVEFSFSFTVEFST